MINECLVAKNRETLQIPYEDYLDLMDKVRDGRRTRLVKDGVIVDLQGFLGGNRASAVRSNREEKSAPVAKVPVEFEADTPAAEPIKQVVSAPSANGRSLPEGMDVPPIKKNIAVHFNNHDASGRLFGVFQQYYACLNDACGGTVRVTMKDGFCSLWNYDEWEEFAYIDIFEDQLRIALDPRYTEALQSLNLCEVPRLLSSRRNLVCVQVDGLNNTMLNVLVKAFEEVGLAAS